MSGFNQVGDRKIMRNESHTLIGTVLKAVQNWRKANDWSRETVTQQIVFKFYELEGDKLTGLRFDPETRDVFERQKVMADRVFRWLDDETKDTNLLPSNFLPFILAALPIEHRIECVDEILAGTGLTVRIAQTNQNGCLVHVLQAMAKEVGEATAAMAGLLDGASPEELARAQKEVTEAMGACNVALQVVESYLAKCAK